ncbi:hypothetical protein NWT39_08870 [Nitrososphaera viennensis]|nr:hypothetical protein [Nitrososphaera viennensis]UVS68014.1 hypothetical protein NWT39_08870 [Nitrososphaera viennensis]
MVVADDNDAALHLKNICRQILLADSSIRFAGIANKMGKMVASEFREGVKPLLTDEEVEGSAVKSVLRMKTREDYESRLGRAVYTFTLYEKVKRASIPLMHGDYALLLMSFDNYARHEEIILGKVLPLLKKHRLISSSE